MDGRSKFGLTAVLLSAIIAVTCSDSSNKVGELVSASSPEELVGEQGSATLSGRDSRGILHPIFGPGSLMIFPDLGINRDFHGVYAGLIRQGYRFRTNSSNDSMLGSTIEDQVKGLENQGYSVAVHDSAYDFYGDKLPPRYVAIFVREETE
jgi:hypothetical protein